MLKFILIFMLLITSIAYGSDKDIDMDTALYLAVKSGNLEEVKKIIKKGVNINALLYSDDYTALIYASENGNSDIVKFLINAGADLNIKPQGHTALLCASQDGHLEVVKLLINGGADINIKSNSGYTALMLAFDRSHTKTVKLLLDNSAGNTLGDAVMLNNFNKVSSLIKGGANINANNGMALVVASQKGYTKIAKLLIDSGVNVNTKNSALKVASLWGNTEIVKLLIDNGVDVNSKTNYGEALRFAAQNGHTDIVKMLLVAGADVNVKSEDMYGNPQTALSMTHDDDIKKLLIDAGAK